MALETVVYPQDPFGFYCRDFHTSGGDGARGYDHDLALKEEDKTLVGIFDNTHMDHGRLNGNWDSSSSSVMQNVKEWDPNSSPEACTGDRIVGEGSSASASGRRKRRRTKSCKNKEELERQRMTHIAVERNRRKQMNDYLAVIRSLMPASYVQRGDQASIIGGAINFVKELEQLLQTLEAQKKSTVDHQQPNNGFFSTLFADFFTFPQYSTRSTSTHCNNSSPAATGNEPMAENRSALADIEVTMVERHANLKILKKRRPRQLLKMVAGLQCLRLNVLHLNVTTVDQMVLYSLSVKVEDGCQLTTVDEIADAVHHLISRIQEEAALS
uniref:Putative transcription factor bHLH96-like n=1 Tax=Davidia involucrata TaxID=16924 RepID=A0A5B6ZFY5_DAVIN